MNWPSGSGPRPSRNCLTEAAWRIRVSTTYNPLAWCYRYPERAYSQYWTACQRLILQGPTQGPNMKIVSGGGPANPKEHQFCNIPVGSTFRKSRGRRIMLKVADYRGVAGQQNTVPAVYGVYMHTGHTQSMEPDDMVVLVDTALTVAPDDWMKGMDDPKGGPVE